MKDDGWLTVRATAERLGAHENTIRNWCDDGTITGVWRRGEAQFRRIPVSEVERLERERDPAPTGKRRGPKPKPIPVTSKLPFIQRMLVDAVRTRLAELDATQAWLAEQVGVTEKHMSQVMRGTSAGTFTFWQAVVDLLEIEVGWRRRGRL